MFGVVGFRVDDNPEIVCTVYRIVLDFHEDGGERFRYRGDVGVHRIVLKGQYFFARLLESERYLFGCPYFLAWTVGGGIVVRDKIN